MLMFLISNDTILSYPIVTVTLPTDIVALSPATPVSCGSSILTFLPSLYKLKGGNPTGASVKSVNVRYVKGFLNLIA